MKLIQINMLLLQTGMSYKFYVSADKFIRVKGDDRDIMLAMNPYYT